MIEDTVFLHWRMAAARLGLPASVVWRAIEGGRLPHIKSGRSVFVNVESAARALIAESEARIARRKKGG